MSGKELHHKRAPQEAHANRSVKPKSQFRRFLDKSLLVGASVLAFGCAGSVANTQVASLVNISMADTKSQVTVTPDKQKIEKNDKKAEKKELEKISVKWLKDLWKKNVGKAGWKELPNPNGGGWLVEVLHTPDGLFTRLSDYAPEIKADAFSLHVAYTSQKAIKLQNGAVIGGFVIIDEEDKEYKDGMAIEVVKDGIQLGTWKVTFDKLAKAYKEKTGKELKYVSVVVEHDVDKDVGEYVQFYIIPVESFEDVKKGNLRPDMPVLVVGYEAEKKIEDKPLYSAYMETTEVQADVVAKK